jgi:hypothetical protein
MVVQNESNIQLVPRQHINEHLVFTAANNQQFVWNGYW